MRDPRQVGNDALGESVPVEQQIINSLAAMARGMAVPEILGGGVEAFQDAGQQQALMTKFFRHMGISPRGPGFLRSLLDAQRKTKSIPKLVLNDRLGAVADSMGEQH